MKNSIPCYKIFMENSKLVLVHSEHVDHIVHNSDKDQIETYRDNFNWQERIEYLEKNDGAIMIVHSDNIDQLWQSFQNEYSLIAAAGGLVTNKEDKILFIYRRKMWDLPKGKMEDGEEIKETAYREVQEECGLKNLEMGEFLIKTYHTYRNKKGKRKLKTTYWYHMQSDDKPTPQTEEDIELCEYLSLKEFMSKSRKVYSTIWQVLDSYQLR